jgi:hypothetical protein
MHIRFLLVDRRFIDHRIGSRAGAYGQNTPAFSIDHTASNPPSLGRARQDIEFAKISQWVRPTDVTTCRLLATTVRVRSESLRDELGAIASRPQPATASFR